jgi:hypothetical protein
LSSAGRSNCRQSEQLITLIKDFGKWGHAEKIKFFAWHLHTHKAQERFSPADLRACYDAAKYEKPSNINPYIQALEQKKPRQVLRDKNGLYLPKPVRDFYDERYGQREITVQVTQLLSELPRRVPNLAERTFLDEAMICYRHGAFRSAVVMTWSLAYHHLCNYVVSQKLAEFNTKWMTAGYHDKKGKGPVTVVDDFSRELRNEEEVLEVCRDTGIVTKDMYRILHQKLGTRNSAAHPSSVPIKQLQAEEYIDTLVTSVVLKLQWMTLPV